MYEKERDFEKKFKQSAKKKNSACQTKALFLNLIVNYFMRL
jgi:hypothetical protein